MSTINFSYKQSVMFTYIYIQVAIYWRVQWEMTGTHPYLRFIAYTYTPLDPLLIGCTNTHTSRDCLLLHTSRSVSIIRMHPLHVMCILITLVGVSLSRDCCISECTVKHPGMERPFPSVCMFTLPVAACQKLPL